MNARLQGPSGEFLTPVTLPHKVLLYPDITGNKYDLIGIQDGVAYYRERVPPAPPEHISWRA